MKLLLTLGLTFLAASVAVGHDGHSHAPSPAMRDRIERLNTQPAVRLVLQRPQVATTTANRPDMAAHFDAFAENVKVRFDNRFLYVESRGMPDHPMMIGITAWQQQVPLPQNYTGDNAWRIPLHPVPARNPMSAKSNFFRGAIALAVNGVPIFNPIKNDGRTDTLKAGELDQWGGHCGRADDYHYHIAPVHLEKIVGKGNPVGVALDGYPIYGYNDPNGKPPTNLDWLNGHKDADGNYHYHATKTYPYLNGGFYGEVAQRGGQVDPQPRAQGVRQAMPPLRGAKITGFENPQPKSYVVRYEVFGEKRSVRYTVTDNGSATFNFVSPQGTKTENYTPRQRGGGGRGNAAQPLQQEPRGQTESDAGRQGRRGGGDPIARILDANRDGKIDETELRKAAEAIRALDKNSDGQITSDELRGPADGGPRGQGGGPRGEQAGGQGRGGPQPGDGPRQPWILVHADEVDINKDKIVSREEIVGEATRAFAGYDANEDGKLTPNEYRGRGGSRSAMGGFIRGHAQELDRDGDSILTRAEVVGNAERMFGKMDSNQDNKISAEEMEASRRK